MSPYPVLSYLLSPALFWCVYEHMHDRQYINGCHHEYCHDEHYWSMHETNRHSTCHIFMRRVSRHTSTSACPFLVSSCGVVVWCVGRWTYRGIVVLWLLLYWSLTVAIGLAACGCLLLGNLTRFSAFTLLNKVVSRLLGSRTSCG